MIKTHGTWIYVGKQRRCMEGSHLQLCYTNMPVIHSVQLRAIAMNVQVDWHGLARIDASLTRNANRSASL